MAFTQHPVVLDFFRTQGETRRRVPELACDSEQVIDEDLVKKSMHKRTDYHGRYGVRAEKGRMKKGGDRTHGMRAGSCIPQHTD